MKDNSVSPTPGGAKVAYPGLPGSFSFEAAESYFGSAIQLSAYPGFADVMEAVVAGQADYGVFPAENSSTGTISEVYDLLLKWNQLGICGEITLAVRHCLLGLPGARMEDLQEVHSHPQGLWQCAGFLAEHHLSGIPGMNTAICAAEVAQQSSVAVGAIASRAAAKAYGLQVLAEDINDTSHNATRFIIVQNSPGTQGSKTSVVFILGHRPGSLYESLGCFARRGIDLLRIESRPLPDRPFEYSFIVDVAGCAADDHLAQALTELQEHVSYLRVLGSYHPK